MVLYVIGLGLGDEKDITVRGLEAVRRSAKVVLEHYTSILGVDKTKLETFYGKDIVLADRNVVESEADSIYATAKDEDVSFLVVGDPLCATTHTDLIIRARELGVKVEVIHNASVMGAVASCGLQLYSFGQTVSIPLWNENWEPDSFYEKIRVNKMNGMHTLCLLDIKVKEPDFAKMARGKVSYLPPRFMSVGTALEQLLEVEARKGEGVYGPDSQCVGLARLGQPTQQIVAGTMSELLGVDFGEPLHSVIINGTTHPLEDELLKWHRVTDSAGTAVEGTTVAAEGEEAAAGVGLGATAAKGDAEAEGGEQDTPR
ncbi:unnamed protein product [Ectocarpus sp. 12 AP-2014]